MKNFEKNIQSKLYNYEAPYPSDLWNKIESELPSKINKKPIIWFFVGSILIGSGLWAFFYLEGSYFFTNKKYPSSIISESVGQHHINEVSHESAPILTDSIDQYEKVLKPIIHSNSGQTESIEKYKNHSLHSKEIIRQYTKDISHPSYIGTLEELDITPEDKIRYSDQRQPIVSPCLIDPTALLINNQRNFVDGPECPPFKNIKNYKLFTELYYGFDFPIRSLSTRNPEFTNYMTERERSESSLYSFSAGIRFGYITSKNIGIKTGLNYSQINEQFSYLDPEAYQSQTIITIDTIFSGGVATVVIDTSYLSIPGTLEIKDINRYKFIDIPIIGTYEFDFGNKMYYALDFGALINISFSEQGRFINEGGSIAYFTPDRNDSEIIHKTGAGMSLYGSFSFLYRWNKNIDLFVSPSIRYYNKSLTTENYPLTQNYIVPSLNLGFRYLIKK